VNTQTTKRFFPKPEDILANVNILESDPKQNKNNVGDILCENVSIFMAGFILASTSMVVVQNCSGNSKEENTSLNSLLSMSYKDCGVDLVGSV
jgi:hypothetical protein